MNAAIYRFAPYTGSLKIEQQTFCLVHSLFQFVWLSEDVYIIPPRFSLCQVLFEKKFDRPASVKIQRMQRVQRGRLTGPLAPKVV